MKKNFIKIALFVALQALGFTTQVSSMQVPDKDQNKDKKDVILTLDRRQIQGLPGTGVYTTEQAVGRETKIASNLGCRRAGFQIVERQEFPDKKNVFCVPLNRLKQHLAAEWQPGQCAYPVHHTIDAYGNSLLHTILKVLLDLEYKIRMLAQDANKEYVQALAQAQIATRESLNYFLALPAIRTPHAEDKDFLSCPVINGQNKAGITPAHLCVAWLNPDALGMLAAVGADDRKDAATQRADITIDNGVYRNLLHFLVVFLHDGKEYQTLFGCPMAAMTDAGTKAIKDMIRTLILDYQLPVLKVVRDTFAHPDYAGDRDGQPRDNKEVALLRAVPDYILEALIIPLTPKIAEALGILLPVKQLYKTIAQYAAHDDIRDLFKKAQ